MVAKEKERLQSEIEIAREVQSQLYPRVVPQTRQLRMTAICQPARMVSGDYYDYEIDPGFAGGAGHRRRSREGNFGGAADGDAAKLAAHAVAELAGSRAAAAGTGERRIPPVSTSHLVWRLNNQLYAYTSPGKIRDLLPGRVRRTDPASSPTPMPATCRRCWCATASRSRLDVNGTVVGAFPFSKYDESRVDLKPGDLLVCFTDGVTEPENEYGEMFGEERLVDLVRKERVPRRRADHRISAVQRPSMDRHRRIAGRYDHSARPSRLIFSD